ncbi:MAG: cytidine deaminase [Paracoccaceae bacterium]
MTLFKSALSARQNAYAPYSNFKVGAAIKTDKGNIYCGCNVENVAYPQGTCAEAGAIAAMIAAGEQTIIEICIVAESRQPVPPCGGCRQKLSEFAQADTPVILSDLQGNSVAETMGALLPRSFTKSHLQE